MKRNYFLSVLLFLLSAIVLVLWLEQDTADITSIDSLELEDNQSSRQQLTKKTTSHDSGQLLDQHITHHYHHDVVDDEVFNPPLSMSEINSAYSLGSILEQADQTELGSLVDDKKSFHQAWLTSLSVEKIKNIKQGDVIFLQSVDGNVHNIHIGKVEHNDWVQRVVDDSGKESLKSRGKDTFIKGNLIEGQGGYTLQIALAEDFRMGESSVLGKFYTPSAPYLIKSSKSQPNKIYMLSYSKRVLEKDRWESVE